MHYSCVVWACFWEAPKTLMLCHNCYVQVKYDDSAFQTTPLESAFTRRCVSSALTLLMWQCNAT